jgi:hypothetical protein
MDDETMIKEWDKFAKLIGGTVQTSNANYFDHDNYYKIKADNSEIELTWGNQPQRGHEAYVTLETKIRYSLKDASSVTLKFRPNDLLTKIFSFKRQKFGINKLDKAYSFSN